MVNKLTKYFSVIVEGDIWVLVYTDNDLKSPSKLFIEESYLRKRIFCNNMVNHK